MVVVCGPIGPQVLHILPDSNQSDLWILNPCAQMDDCINVLRRLWIEFLACPISYKI